MSSITRMSEPGATPNNLPVLRSALVGRQAAVAAAGDLLRRDDVGLLTFTGPGGVGKTRLALQLASQLLERFPHGVFFVNLAPISDPNLVISTIAQTLGMRENPGQPLIESLQSYLRDREMLLVLDNFEQVVEAAPAIGELLAASPRLKVLATSRELLRLHEEQVFPVPPLEFPEPKHLLSLERLTEYEAVSLFIQRARNAQPDFQVTHANALAVAGICRRLNGLPLAIELAAAHVRLLTPQAILGRLKQHRPLLAGGFRDLPLRHQTLRNTVAWSYDLLGDADKTLFRRLVVFVGGGTPEAVEAVCRAVRPPDLDVLTGVASLADKSLLQKEEAAGGERRFVMLETIREYASEQLQASGEAEEMRRRHARYFTALAQDAEPRLKGAEQKRWLDRLETEHDNFRAALTWSLGRQDVVTASSLAGHLGYFWFMRSHFREGLNWSTAAIRLYDLKGRVGVGAEEIERTAADDPGLSAPLARAFWAAGLLATWQGHGAYAIPRSYLERSAALARAVADQPLLADALLLLGIVLNFERDYDAAHARIEESLAVAREAAYTWGIANALDRLGSAHVGQGDLALRRARREQSLALRRQVDDRGGIAVSLLGLGEMTREVGDYAEARRCFERALPIFREVGSPLNVAITLSNLGYVLRHLRDDGQAAHTFKEALVLARDLNSKVLTLLALAGLAGLAAAQGGVAGAAQAAGAVRAARLLGAATALLEDTGDFLEPVDRADFDANVAATRARLDEHSFAAAWAEGHALSMTEAIAYAQEAVPPASPARPPAAGAGPTALAAEPAYQSLTKRELEILRLVAEGLTSPEIAKRLTLSTRTVENHLRSIFGKLDVSTRAAATRIAVEHGLLND